VDVERPPEGSELDREDLELEDGHALPDKEAMSVVSADLSGIDNFAMPINEAIAINNQSAFSYAIADADQIVFIEQQDVDPDVT
jgi:hypothetical protein